MDDNLGQMNVRSLLNRCNMIEGCLVDSIYVWILISICTQNGKCLIAGSHYASTDIKSRVDELFHQWQQLGMATKKKELMLEETLSLVLFNRKVDGVQSLIRDRLAVASSRETGRDLEHCKVLIRKFNDFDKVKRNS